MAMNLTQDAINADFMITGYRSDCILVNRERYDQSLVVCPDKLITPWKVTSMDQLNEENVTAIFKLKPEIVLLGTGERLILPAPKILALFARCNVGLETMNTSAACRTYGILLAEGRKAAAAIIFPD